MCVSVLNIYCVNVCMQGAGAGRGSVYMSVIYKAMFIFLIYEAMYMSVIYEAVTQFFK